jgi:tetratricopeptide (TPR) repeat protein
MKRVLLLLAALVAPASARADWYEASTAHFVVYSEQSPDKLQQFASRLERFDAAIRFLRGLPDDPVGKANRVTVYVVNHTGDVERLAFRNAAGFYIPRAGGSLAVVPRRAGASDADDLSAQAILLHEYTHHLFWTQSPNAVYPAWYIEGYAETLATVKFYDDGAIDYGRPPQYRGYGLLSGNALPIQKLLVADTLKLDDQQRDGLYGRGWLLSHYLLLSGKRQGQLAAYLTDINAGKPPLEAAKAFGDLRELDRELERYKRGTFGVRKLSASVIKPAAIEMRKLTAGEAATMDVRIRSKVGVNGKTAPGVYARAKRAAAPYPDDCGAQLVLAETAYDARDFAAAEAAADRALKADPKAVDGYVYKAMARMAIANNAGDKTPATWSAIRKIIAAGNRIDPEDPEPLILYYRSFVDAGVKPSDNAKAGLHKAFQLAPQDDGLRFNLAKMLLRDGEKAGARAMLAPLAYQPHGKGLAVASTALIKLIDSGDTEAVMRELDESKDGKSEPEET